MRLGVSKCRRGEFGYLAVVGSGQDVADLLVLSSHVCRYGWLIVSWDEVGGMTERPVRAGCGADPWSLRCGDQPRRRHRVYFLYHYYRYRYVSYIHDNKIERKINLELPCHISPNKPAIVITSITISPPNYPSKHQPPSISITTSQNSQARIAKESSGYHFLSLLNTNPTSTNPIPFFAENRTNQNQNTPFLSQRIRATSLQLL